MSFIKYPHLERLGNTPVNGITVGTTYIFPKLDGTNASIWKYGDRIRAGSRTRELDTVNHEQDNAGFAKWVSTQDQFNEFFEKYPDLVVYGEWLVPHTIKNYRNEMWRRFWVFDVYDRNAMAWLPYDEYAPIVAGYFDVIPYIAICHNATPEQLLELAQKCTFGMPDGAGPGEGIVIKNYNWRNSHDNITWAKVVLNSFKDDHVLAMKGVVLNGEASNASIIANKVCTPHLIRKEHAKILVANNGEWHNKLIPRLLHQVYYSVVTEELWDCLKTIKNGSVDFNELRLRCEQKTKATMTEIFGGGYA
jgi:RNA ligase